METDRGSETSQRATPTLSTPVTSEPVGLLQMPEARPHHAAVSRAPSNRTASVEQLESLGYEVRPVEENGDSIHATFLI